MIRTLTSLAALVLAAALSSSSAGAQSYPSKPVTIIVPLAAGTGMDTVVRLYGEKLQQVLGRPVVVENRPGAALAIGAVAIATAAPDGHTIGVLTSGPMTIGPALYKKISYDPQKFCVPISLYVKSPLVLVVNPALPIKSVSELIEYAKKNPTPLTYSTPGAGAFQHLATEFMAQRFGLKLTHVPYKSTPQSITDIVAGHVDSRLCRGRRVVAADPREQAARAGGFVNDAAADGPRRAALRGRSESARVRSRVVACPGGARGDAEGHRRSPAHGDVQDYVGQ